MLAAEGIGKGKSGEVVTLGTSVVVVTEIYVSTGGWKSFCAADKLSFGAASVAGANDGNPSGEYRGRPQRLLEKRVVISLAPGLCSRKRVERV